VALADPAVYAVGGHDQVGVGEAVEAVDLGLEGELDAQVAGAGLQDLQQLLAADAAEAVAARAHRLALEMDLDIVPVGEVGTDLGRALGVVRLQVVQRLLRQHHAPAEGVVRAVALDDADPVRGIAALHRDREIEAGRPAAYADDAHDHLLAEAEQIFYA